MSKIYIAINQSYILVAYIRVIMFFRFSKNKGFAHLRYDIYNRASNTWSGLSTYTSYSSACTKYEYKRASACDRMKAWNDMQLPKPRNKKRQSSAKTQQKKGLKRREGQPNKDLKASDKRHQMESNKVETN